MSEPVRIRLPPDPPKKPEWEPRYSPWRHGGWYVLNVRFPSGGCGTVSRNYKDGKWRVVEDREEVFEKRKTYPNRDAAAHALAALVLAEGGRLVDP